MGIEANSLDLVCDSAESLDWRALLDHLRK
jgi:hypothetical protein